MALLCIDQMAGACGIASHRRGPCKCAVFAGVGEKKALQLVQKFKDMKEIMGSLEGGKYVVPEPFPFEEARKLFKGRLPFLAQLLTHIP